MLSRTLAVAAVACALAGCVSVSASSPPTGALPAAQTAIGAVQTAARTYCGTVPTAESVEALLGAAAGAYTVQNIAAIACGGFRAVSAFTAETDRPARKRRLRKGEVVTGTAVVNGRAVPVTGTVEVPARAPAR